MLYLPSEKDISSILYMGESNVYNKKYNATLVEIYIYYKVYYVVIHTIINIININPSLSIHRPLIGARKTTVIVDRLDIYPAYTILKSHFTVSR